MPQTLKKITNTTVIYGQHYKKKSLTPGKELRSEGICHVFALAWVKNVHTLNTFNSRTINIEVFLFSPLKKMISIRTDILATEKLRLEEARLESNYSPTSLLPNLCNRAEP